MEVAVLFSFHGNEEVLYVRMFRTWLGYFSFPIKHHFFYLGGIKLCLNGLEKSPAHIVQLM